MELAEQFEQLRSGLLSELTQAIHAVIRKELDTALAPLKSTLSEISSLYESHEERICGIEATLDQSEQRLVQVEAKLNTVQTENAWLKEKVDDLENRSRRLNLRVVGIPERVEGSNPVAFMTHFFEEIFGKDFFSLVHTDWGQPSQRQTVINAQESSSLHSTTSKTSSGSSFRDVNGKWNFVATECFSTRMSVLNWDASRQHSRR